MTARIGAEPDMDAYSFIDDGYSRLDHLDGLGSQADIQAMNLRDAAEYRARHARIAHPRYKRHGRIDGVTGEWHSYTAAELADRAYERKWGWGLVGLYSFLALGLVAAVVLIANGRMS